MIKKIRTSTRRYKFTVGNTEFLHFERKGRFLIRLRRKNSEDIPLELTRDMIFEWIPYLIRFVRLGKLPDKLLNSNSWGELILAQKFRYSKYGKEKHSRSEWLDLMREALVRCENEHIKMDRESFREELIQLATISLVCLENLEE